MFNILKKSMNIIYVICFKANNLPNFMGVVLVFSSFDQVL